MSGSGSVFPDDTDSQGVECCDLYWCPNVGEVECPRHSGFDVCCDGPERHVNPETHIAALRVEVDRLRTQLAGTKDDATYWRRRALRAEQRTSDKDALIDAMHRAGLGLSLVEATNAVSAAVLSRPPGVCMCGRPIEEHLPLGECPEGGREDHDGSF